MKCADIPTAPILLLLADRQGEWTCWSHDGLRAALPEGLIPEKVRRAKMSNLLRKGLIEGCDCGCRGDWEITDKGLARIGRERVAPMINAPLPVRAVAPGGTGGAGKGPVKRKAAQVR